MADIDMNFLGAQMQRLQQDVRELRFTVDLNRKEGYALYQAHAEHVDKSLAAIQSTLDARMDAFDQRFTYLDEQISRLDGRLDGVEGRLNSVDSRLGRMENLLSELKTLVVAGRGEPGMPTA